MADAIQTNPIDQSQIQQWSDSINGYEKQKKFSKEDVHQIKSIAARMINELNQGNKTLFPLANRLIGLCHQKAIKAAYIEILDQKLHAQDGAFQILTNQQDFAHWQKWGFSIEVFANHNSFAKYLLGSLLGNQMKIFNDPIIFEKGVPGVLVEGSWKSIEEIQERFEEKYVSELKEKCIVEKSSGKVFTFLGNGLGLQEHNPYTNLKLNPITCLNLDEYQKTLEVARQFVRKDESAEDPQRNEGRDFIYQIVSSYVTNSCNTNVMELMYRRKHPWIRVICGSDHEGLGVKKGDVYEVGYGWSAPSKLVAATSTGRFRTIDVWNYKQPAERVVTNIAITKDEAATLFKYIVKHHPAGEDKLADKIAFNLLRQNCSAFVHYCSKAIGIDVPTRKDLIELLQEISPNWMKAVGRGYLAVKEGFFTTIDRIGFWVPRPVIVLYQGGKSAGSWLIAKIINAVTVPFAAIGSFFLGGASGKAGKAFEEEGTENKKFVPALQTPKDALDARKKFYYHLPGELQRWQRLQPSTRIYEKPIKLSIVPAIEQKEEMVENSA